MIERILLYLAIGGVFWALLWLYRKENRPDIADDPTPFAIRLDSDFEPKPRPGDKRNR